MISVRQLFVSAVISVNDDPVIIHECSGDNTVSVAGGDGNVTHTSVFSKSVSPVPITEKILKFLGFKKKEVYYDDDDGKRKLLCTGFINGDFWLDHEEDKDRWSYCKTHIHYLHELQYFMTLSGIDYSDELSVERLAEIKKLY